MQGIQNEKPLHIHLSLKIIVNSLCALSDPLGEVQERKNENISCVYQKQSRSEKLSQYLGRRELKTEKSMYSKKKTISLAQTSEIIILNSPLLSVWQNPAMGL